MKLLMVLLLSFITAAVSGCGFTRFSLIDANGTHIYGSLPPHFDIGKTYPWVIFDHGHGEGGSAIFDDPQVVLLTNALSEAGYVVVSSDYRTEDCWGDSSCVEDAKALYEISTKALNLDPRPFVLGQSMGGMVMWNSILHGAFAPRAAAGIYPACSLLNLYENPSFTSEIESDYSFTGMANFADGTKGYDPVGSESLFPMINVPVIIWSSYGDTVVPRVENEDPFAAAVKLAGGNVTVITTTGDHGDQSNFQPDMLVNFFNQYRAKEPDQ